MGAEYGSNAIALLDSRELASDDFRQCLSPGEELEFAAFRNPRRRNEWLAGRLCSKYLFLNRDAARSEEPGLTRLSGRSLTRFHFRQYREAVVVKSDAAGGGPPLISWPSGEGVRSVAISHARGLACARIGGGLNYALDLEACEQRIPAFYRQHFTTNERTWADSCVSRFGVASYWTYTLLWSVKECLMKTPAFAKLSLWNTASMEVNFVSGCEALKSLHSAEQLDRNLRALHAEVSLASDTGQQREPICVNVCGSTDLVLTCISALN